MTRDDHHGLGIEKRILYVVACLSLGFIMGLFAGRFIDRDRDQYIEVFQAIDGDRIDLHADTVWHTSPMRVMPDPEGK